MNDSHITVNVSTRTIVVAILFVLLIALLFFLKDLVLVVLTAIVLASSIEPAVRWFVKYRIPRVVSVLLVYIITIVVFGGLFYFFLPPILDEASSLLSILPQYIDTWTIPTSLEGGLFAGIEDSVQSISLKEAILAFRDAFTSTSEGFLRALSFVFGGVFSLILIIVLSFYFAVRETGVDDFLRVVTPIKQQEYVVGLWKRSQAKIGLWMQGQLMLSIILMVLVYLGLAILNVKYALLLAIIAGVLDLIPIFGSILAAVPAVVLAFLDGGITLALLVTGLYLIVNQFEANLIYPLVVKKVIGVSPLLVILALIVGFQVAGFLGIILSVPVAAALQEFVTDIQKGRRALLDKQTAKK
jgi:predicted PurR-regulated permease PerM